MYSPPKRRTITKSERQKIYDKCGGHCAYCGQEITIQQMQADHIIPMVFYESYLTKGINIDTVDNMLPSCRSCNHYKSSMSLEDFRGSIERWTTVLARDSVTYRNAVRFGMVIPNDHKVRFYFEKEDV